jgi:putative oxidoreductase
MQTFGNERKRNKSQRTTSYVGLRIGAAKATGLLSPIIAKLESFGPPVIDLLLRVWIGLVFYRSGQQKLDDWDSTLFLFGYEYMVPVLPHTFTAYLATGFELAMPVLLFIGLAGRLAALPLLSMALTIQFVLGSNNAAY